jgi:hypothetical protein
MLAVVALCAATGLAGCGDDKDKDPVGGTTAAVETPTPKPQSPADQPDATPTEKWVRQTCDKLEAGMKALQPPNIKGTSPEDTKKSLVTFFTQLADQLGNQEKILNEVGPPPGKNAQREFKDALEKLAEVRGKLERVVSRVESSDATTKKAMDALVVDLGESLKVMADYDGPIAQLAKTNALKDALSAEPGCGSLGMQPPQPTE